MRAAIFDLDGTLIDSNGVWMKIDLDFLARRGLSPTAEYTEFVSGTNFREAAEYTIAYYKLDATAEEILNCWLEMAQGEYANNIRPKPGALAYIDKLKAQGAKIGIATTCMRPLCEAVLENCGILGLFDAITTGSEVGKSKSLPDIFLLEAEKLRVSPGLCTVYDDSPLAVSGARAAGMEIVGVYDEFYAPYEEEMRRRCDRYIRGFEELL